MLRAISYVLTFSGGAVFVLIAGHTSFAGVCMADPTAWIAALIPLIPYYFHVMKKYKNKSQVQVIED